MNVQIEYLVGNIIDDHSIVSKYMRDCIKSME